MDSDYVTSLYHIRSQFSTYVTIPICILSIIGEIFNIIVFLSLKTFRQNSCAFYLMSMSIFNFIRLVFSTLFIVISTAFSIDWSFALFYYCQFRNLIVASCNLSAITCLCLAIADQYFATCSRHRLQQWSNIKIAYRVTGTIAIVWILHAIPYCIYFNQLSMSNNAVCITKNPIFLKYHTYGYFLTYGNLFPLIAVIFGVMSFRNARNLTTRANLLVRRELDKQLTMMVLVEICVYVLTYIPYSISNGYSTLNTNRDPTFLAQLNLINTVTMTLSIISNGNSFFIYICVSRRFRRQAKYVLYENCRNHNSINRIAPERTEMQVVTERISAARAGCLTTRRPSLSPGITSGARERNGKNEIILLQIK
ncbi:unnamed protein product [Adineta ricciae]|uniref:G-protein coupled receptors family 1 profile domain-containing protein n=1 Tax=Adineta ricciae TaxID=249248 RepID=A0A815ZXT8_ADIRI|nr:unnamed protein product [Adineta ricciae]